MASTPPTANPEADMRPVVAGRSSNLPVWLFGLALGAVAIGLFVGLEARRTDTARSALAGSDDPGGAFIAAPPMLAVPGEYGPQSALPPLYRGLPPAGQRLAPPAAGPVTEGGGGMRIPVPRVSYPAPPTYMGPPRSNQPDYLAPAAPVAPAASLPAGAGERASASWLANPARTVPQGTVIHAVMETALDSTRPGFARAVVSRDVTSFDGSRVLIPRGSRLFGEYAADLAFGQKRALIRWRRLTRPDGAIIDVDSPSADTLGRAGVRGKVNSHFFERFSGAILQSALDAGVQIATRAASSDTVILGLPGSSQSVSSEGPRPESIRPTLKVKQGASVAVFVARDLDFAGVDP